MLAMDSSCISLEQGVVHFLMDVESPLRLWGNGFYGNRAPWLRGFCCRPAWERAGRRMQG